MTTGRNHLTDLRGASRMAVDATLGVTDLVEALHRRIARTPARLGGPLVEAAVEAVAGLVYGSIRGVTRVVGCGVEAVLAQLSPLVAEVEPTPAREALAAVLNGVLGDYLAATGNPLAIEMTLRRDGTPLEPAPAAPAGGASPARRRLLVLVHGLCRNDLQWRRHGHDHGAALERDLGYEPLYLHYNSGLHVATNGRAFAQRLEALVAVRPLAELAIVAHSIGGLVARAALHYGAAAHHDWPRRVSAIVFLGTPHHGAPLERGGHWLETLLGATPYTAPFRRLGRVRSAGITDLRHGCVLEEDWQRRDRPRRRGDPRRPLPLPAGVPCFAVAAHFGKAGGRLGGHLLGDGLVPIASALGRHRDPRFVLDFPSTRQWIAHETGHLDLLSRPAVYRQIRDWLAP